MNLLFIIVAASLAVGAVWGWKRGFLEGLIRIISCILGIFVLVIVAKGIGSFLQGSIISVMVAVLLLIVIRLIHKAIKFLIDTFKLVRAIPIGKLADKLAGTALGAVEAVFVIWLVYLLIGSFDLFGLHQWVLAQTAQSKFLTIIYSSNYLVALLKQIL
ncbi:MAG: CvpA family protein [Lachnospiraceae bacterium]|jgi:Colicin V production protein.|nr:CvpA family protein [Lachnospiraceae bacterium]MDE7207243.1 CvpA family protein [Lachnospiraceae bacterium]